MLRTSSGIFLSTKKSDKQTFTGAAVTDWLLTNYASSRRHAVEIGQALLERGYFHNVNEELNNAGVPAADDLPA